MNSLIVIPARLDSSRLPNKPLLPIAGKILIQRVWELCGAVPSVNKVCIATDSDELRQRAEAFGADVIMTSTSCRNGTERVAEAVQKIGSSFDCVVNVQGDAVRTPPSIIEAVLQEMQQHPELALASPMVALRGSLLQQMVADKRNGSTSGTMVTFDKSNNALYFSKSLIPCFRDGLTEQSVAYKHIGIYAYRPATLEKLCELAQSAFESVEKLEQLRALENGIPIRMVEVDTGGVTLASVDTQTDLERAESLIAAEGEILS